jgi:hypothetical protein
MSSALLAEDFLVVTAEVTSALWTSQLTVGIGLDERDD